MNNIQRDIKNTDGTIDTLMLTSNDDYILNIPKNYKLVNNIQKKENKLVNKFKNSFLGAEIGVKAEGFSTIAILSTIIAIGTLCIMYILWRI